MCRDRSKGENPRAAGFARVVGRGRIRALGRWEVVVRVALRKGRGGKKKCLGWPVGQEGWV